MRSSFQLLFLVLAFALLSGCSSPRPVLYPNGYYMSVGKKQANRDIDQAMKRADEFCDKSTGKYAKHAGKTATSAAVGAGSGAAVGAISGGVGIGTVTGAVSGASSGLINWLFSPSDLSPIYKKFVEKELRKKGYEVIGWD